MSSILTRRELRSLIVLAIILAAILGIVALTRRQPIVVATQPVEHAPTLIDTVKVEINTPVKTRKQHHRKSSSRKSTPTNQPTPRNFLDEQIVSF